MNRLAQIFKVRPDESRRAMLLVGLMIFTSAGGSIGGNGIDALFFSRYGVRNLPFMYIALGFVALATTVVVAVLLARFSPQRLFIAMPLVIAAVLVIERAVVASGVRWIYPVIWVGMNVKGALQGLLTWGLAGLVFDTRQAKRLFPLLGAGNILGAVVGGLSTPTIAGVIHAENLLLVWASALLLAFVVAVGLPRSSLRRTSTRRPGRGAALRELRQGYRTVTRSKFLGWLALSAVSLAILMYSIAFPFSKAVAARFPNEDALAGFLGVFQGASTGVAFTVSLLIANRLFSRFGIMRMILVFPLIHLAGFGTLVVAAPFALIAGFRFVQTVWQQGIFFSAYQASFNVVPPDRKDQARAFIEGAGTQAGTVAAGVLLLLGDRVLRPRSLFLLGLATAGVGIAIIWRASRGYGLALVDALREGRPHVFFAEDEAFGGFQRDAGAIAAAVDGLKGSDRPIRRVSAEILSNVSLPVGPAGSAAVEALVAATKDRDASVRVSAIRGLVKSGATHALLEIAARLKDAEPEVRTEAIHGIQSLSPSPASAAEIVRPLLSDRDPEVRAHAAVVLMRSRSEADALRALNTIENMLRVEGAFTSVAATAALGDWGDPSVAPLVLEQAVCPEPPVRRAAAIALASFEPAAAIPALIQLLRDPERRVRDAAVESLATLGDAALPEVIEALREPDLESSALEVLERHAPVNSSRGMEIERHAREASSAAIRYIELWHGALSAGDDERVALLADVLRDRALGRASASLRALGALSSRDSMDVVLENLNGRDAIQRANALETLESAVHRDVVAPLLPLWEPAPDGGSYPRDWLARVLRDVDPWLRACAVIAWQDQQSPDVLPELQAMAVSDPDEEVRATANRILGGPSMETLATTSLLERIILLRRVPLFAELPSDDLKQIASIAGERSYSDGEAIATEGDLGDEMYLIVSGEVGVVIGPHSLSENEVARRIPGDYVGEMSLITRGPRTASLIAHGVVRVLFIDQRHFESLIRERPDVSLKLMKALVEKVHESNRLLPQELAVKLETARVRRSMAGEERVVSILFCDLTGPTAMAEHLARDEWSAVMDKAYEILVAPIYRHEGALVRTMGDAILAFFGAPIAHDDDPVRAVRAAIEMVAAVQELREDISAELGVDFDVRVGINTGPVEVGEVGSDLRLEYSSLGEEVNIAGRMEETAPPGTVQISDNTQKLVLAMFDLEELGPIEVKGHIKAINTFRVLGEKTNPGST